MTYDVEGWVVLRYTTPGTKLYYRIFASWRDGDLWRLSSGSDELPQLSTCGKFWIWPQASGACYQLPIGEEGGYTFYTGRVLSNIMSVSGKGGTCIDRVKLASLFAKK
jgi:hypothetical protein